MTQVLSFLPNGLKKICVSQSFTRFYGFQIVSNQISQIDHLLERDVSGKVGKVGTQAW